MGNPTLEYASEWVPRQEAEVQTFPQDDCLASDCTILLVIYGPIDRFLDAKYLNILAVIGLRPWRAEAEIRVKDGKVREKGFGLGVRTPHRGWLAGGYGDVDSLPPPPERYPNLHVVPGEYSIHRYQVHDGIDSWDSLSATVTLTADAVYRRRARDIRFHCATSWWGCKDLCELIPGIWTDFTDHQRKIYPDQAWGKGSSHCMRDTAE